MIANLVSPLFVGRTAELATVDEAAERARSGIPTAVLLAGEAGVGKSRLLAEASGRLRDDGWRVLTGECFELGTEGLPFAPLVDILRRLAATTTPAELDSYLGPARRELAWLLPELGDDEVAHGGASQAQLLERLVAMLGRLAQTRPLLLVIEDLHWADRSTLDLVAFLVRALRDLPILLLMTYRSDELHRHHPLRPLLTSWDRARSVRRIELRRLDRDEVAAQLGAILREPPPAKLVDAVFERSAGNAYFAEEVLGIIQQGRPASDLPPLLRDVLLTHTEALTDASQALLRAASAAGTSVSEELLAAVVGLGAAEFSAALREIVERHLMVVDDVTFGYSFRHALTRDAVYHDMLPGERVQLHAAYGEALTASPHLAGRAASAMLAHHWFAALDLPRALVAAIDAGRQAESRAPADALRHFERALEVWPRVTEAERFAGADQVEVLQLAASAAWYAGSLDRSLKLLDQALVEIPGGRDDPRRVAVLNARARALRDLGREAESFRVLTDALALVPPEPPSQSRAHVLAAMANTAVRLGQMEQSVRLSQAAVDAARAAGAPEQEADANVSLGFAWINLGSVDEGLEAIRTGLAKALELNALPIALRAYINLADALEGICRHTEACETAREGLELAAQQSGTRAEEAYLAGNMAEPLMRLGRWDEAYGIAATALHSDREGLFASTLLEIVAQVAVYRGDYDEAGLLLGDANLSLAGETDLQFTLPLAFIEAEIERGCGRPDNALRVIDEAFGDDDIWPRYRWPLVWLAARSVNEQRVRARDSRQQTSDTESSMDRWSKAADVLPADTAHARAYRALVAAERQGPARGDLQTWSAAVQTCREADDPFLVAHALLQLAEAYVATSDRAGAAATVRESLEIAQRLGAAPLVTAATNLARRARLSLEPSEEVAVPANDTALDLLGLTERERDVLALVAAGRQNTQIAQALFISPKTVSVHVSNILTKLNVHGRVEAAALAHRAGLFGPAEIAQAAQSPPKSPSATPRTRAPQI